ncbi:four-helix bundle copper-binding protein [Azospirillum sp. TSO5]|uniref:four-helix bundle copper-binding protein n=1 Tax=Azospirillum sp. TSO5 TaxID=716760 RepID=UPI000D60C129|nr:four-helix bundle copper-binding protein [Azospirillum sp. TSO5]PWC97614.1 ferredoxin [Azospirillum sp. TSO5]
MAGSPSMDDCIRNCTDCHTICLETVAHCLTKGGAHAEAGHIRLLLDCVDICRTSADFIIRGSRFHHLTCGACAEICAACADDCDRMADDSMMKRCAEMCRRCAESCRSMSRMAA